MKYLRKIFSWFSRIGKKKPKKYLKSPAYICHFCNKAVGKNKKVLFSEPLKKHGFKHMGHKLCLQVAMDKINRADKMAEVKQYWINS